jgi:hypothetical protein
LGLLKRLDKSRRRLRRLCVRLADQLVSLNCEFCPFRNLIGLEIISTTTIIELNWVKRNNYNYIYGCNNIFLVLMHLENVARRKVPNVLAPNWAAGAATDRPDLLKSLY